MYNKNNFQILIDLWQAIKKIKEKEKNKKLI
jgi:hypothetical protein